MEAFIRVVWSVTGMRGNLYRRQESTIGEPLPKDISSQIYYPESHCEEVHQVTGPLDGPVRIELRSTVVHLSEAPDAITVPAGEFPYLRLHQTTTGDLRYEGDPDFEALGALDLVTEVYSWNTHFLGTVVSVSQSSIAFRNGGAPPVVTTQVVRLLEASGIPSVVASIGWGQLKANHMATLQSGR